MADGGRDEVFFRICPVHGKLEERHWNGHSCKKCLEYNKTNGGRRKAQPKVERFEDNGVERYSYVGRFDGADFEKWLQRLAKDPARMAAAIADTRRPRGVNRNNHGVAIRRYEPMLNADPKAIRVGLAKQDEGKIVHAKGSLYRTVRVKPLCLSTAKASGGSWREREWTVWTLQYGKGLVLVTDDGRESPVFSGWKSLMHAILGSGWGITG